MPEAGHKFWGKKRLRPGGRATDIHCSRRTFKRKENTRGCVSNRGTTAIELVTAFGCKITAVDMDAQALEVAAKIRWNGRCCSFNQF